MPYDVEKWYNYYIHNPTVMQQAGDWISPLLYDWFETRDYDPDAALPSTPDMLRARTQEQQFQMDCALWYGSLTQGAGSAEITGFFKRLFRLLYSGGLLYYANGFWMPFAYSEAPLASVISHGGRILIQIPFAERENDDGFFDWLGGGIGNQNVIRQNHRLAATHGVSLLEYRDMQALWGGRYQRVLEDKGGKVGLLPGSLVKNHYGINIALGGTGKTHPITGNIISANGEFGHLYVFYLRPTSTTYGGLLFGCEGSAPVDRWENATYRPISTTSKLGLLPGALQMIHATLREKILKSEESWTPDQTGGYHKTGSRQEFAASGGKKWDELAAGPDRVYNAFIIDLCDNGWKWLQNAREFDPRKLGSSGAPPVPISKPHVPAAILSSTCLTAFNLKQLKNETGHMIKEMHQFNLGNPVPNRQEIDFKKQWKYYPPKTRSEIAPSAKAHGSRIQPNATTAMSIGDWKSFSSITFGARNKIVPVDQAVQQLITATNEFITKYEVVVEMRLKLTPTNDDLAGRAYQANRVIDQCKRYLNARGLSGKRSLAVMNLWLIVNRELDLLTDARNNFGRMG